MELDPNRILDHIESLIQQLTKKNDDYEKFGTEHAIADRHYRIERQKAIVRLRNQGHSVTVVKALADGQPKVASAKDKMMVKEVSKQACLESMRNLREAIGAYRSFLTWKRAEMHEHSGVRI